MASYLISHVKISAIATAVPWNVIDNRENTDFSKEEVDKIVASTGVVTRRVTSVTVCTSDLCFEAAENLLKTLSIQRDEIDIIVFVSQTPDYILPATACILQEKLKLKTTVMAFDVNLGCSGYVYGLILLAQLLSSGQYRKALLLGGDTISKLVAPKDRSVAFLFGDAGSASLLEYDQEALDLAVDFGTDGTGVDKLKVAAGGFRCPSPPRAELFMSGADIFSFTLKEVPKTIETVLKIAQLSKSKIDFYIFHQANIFMLNHLIKKMELSATQVPISLQEYGNTSVASIPLTLCVERAKIEPNVKLLLCGFGVGFSWASLIMTAGQLAILEPIIVRDI